MLLQDFDKESISSASDAYIVFCFGRKIQSVEMFPFLLTTQIRSAVFPC